MTRIELVDNWHRSWRWFSVQMHAAATTLLLALQFAPFAPAEIQMIIPQPWGVIVTILWLVAGVYARIVKQPAKGTADGE